MKSMCGCLLTTLVMGTLCSASFASGLHLLEKIAHRGLQVKEVGSGIHHLIKAAKVSDLDAKHFFNGAELIGQAAAVCNGFLNDMTFPKHGPGSPSENELRGCKVRMRPVCRRFEGFAENYEDARIDFHRLYRSRGAAPHLRSAALDFIGALLPLHVSVPLMLGRTVGGIIEPKFTASTQNSVAMWRDSFGNEERKRLEIPENVQPRGKHFYQHLHFSSEFPIAQKNVNQMAQYVIREAKVVIDQLWSQAEQPPLSRCTTKVLTPSIQAKFGFSNPHTPDSARNVVEKLPPIFVGEKCGTCSYTRDTTLKFNQWDYRFKETGTCGGGMVCTPNSNPFAQDCTKKTQGEWNCVEFDKGASEELRNRVLEAARVNARRRLSGIGAGPMQGLVSHDNKQAASIRKQYEWNTTANALVATFQHQIDRDLSNVVMKNLNLTVPITKRATFGWSNGVTSFVFVNNEGLLVTYDNSGGKGMTHRYTQPKTTPRRHGEPFDILANQTVKQVEIEGDSGYRPYLYVLDQQGRLYRGRITNNGQRVDYHHLERYLPQETRPIESIDVRQENGVINVYYRAGGNRYRMNDQLQAPVNAPANG